MANSEAAIARPGRRPEESGSADVKLAVRQDQWVQAQLKEGAAQRRRHSMSVWGLRLAILAAVLGAWQLGTSTGRLSEISVSNPSAVAQFLLDNLGTTAYWNDVKITVLDCLAGYVVASVAAVVVAFVLGTSKVLLDSVNPILSFLNSLPRIALAPLFIVWFGLGELPQIVLAFSLCFFIVLNGVLVGLDTVDPDQDFLTRQLGGGSFARYRKLVIPSALPSLLASQRLALVYGFLGVVVGEMLSGTVGVGGQIARYSGLLQTDGIFGNLIVLGAVVSIGVEAIRRIERRLLRWQ